MWIPSLVVDLVSGSSDGVSREEGRTKVLCLWIILVESVMENCVIVQVFQVVHFFLRLAFWAICA